VLLPAVTLLNGLGLALISRLDVAYAERARQAGRALPAPSAPQQLVWTTVGVALFVLVVVLVRDHRRLQRYTYTAGMVGIGLLLLPLLPGLGVQVNGARIWIRAFGLSFQPGEAAKVVLIVAFAGYLVRTRDQLALAGRRFLGLDLPRARDLGPLLAMWAVSLGLLVFQRDLGTSLLFFGVFVVLLYVATERPSWLVVGTALFLGGAWLSAELFSHVQRRVEGWLDPFGDVDANYQIVQALYGLAYGGILGRGLGQGRPDLVPYANSDFIMAALGEELGLTGVMAVVLVYGLVVERGLRTALVARDPFGKLLAVGLATSLALQVFIVVGGVTKLIPLTGLTTPFLSLGGSSLVMNWVLVALLLRVSDAARRPAPGAAPPPDEARTQVVRL
jgi:cell division protein FtsW (lipid II flippase)